MPLHLVRHAHAAPDESSDPALTPLGEAQAARLAERMAGLEVVRVLHGPALRARQTAHLLAARLAGVQVCQSDSARDRTPWPEGDDAAYGLRARRWLQSTPPHERDPGGRDLHSALTSWMELCRDGSTVVVTHAFVVAWVAAHVVGGPADAWLRMPVDNASVTTVEQDRHGDLLLRRFNGVDD
jgi:serine/threonine-protein phosphatase PGAM5